MGLGFARADLSAVVNERAGIRPEMEVKLSEAFGNTAPFWINLEKKFEVRHAERDVKRAEIPHFYEENKSLITI